MLKRLLFNILIIVSLLFTVNVLMAEENPKPEEVEIRESRTPESPQRNSNVQFLYLTAFIVLGCGALIIKENSHKPKLELSIDSIEANGDGSYLISFGYDNPNDTIFFDEGQCGIKVHKGKAILLKKLESNSFIKGRHRNSVIAVINENSEIEYFAGDQKIYIKGKDIIEKEEIEHDEIA